jgi:hypothetical protein|tara:strand:- start:667 stop:777 length:111 start_codon:yes stop_codon:yes gene_type:complete
LLVVVADHLVVVVVQVVIGQAFQVKLLEVVHQQKMH